MGTIESEQPQALVVSQSSAYRIFGKEREESYPLLIEGFVTRWRELQDAGVQVVVLADTPRLGIDVPECLSKPKATIEGCTRTAAQAFARPDPLLAAAEQVGAPVVSMSDVICPGGACPPVIGDVLVWRDSHHLTATFASERGPELAARIAVKLGPQNRRK